jgi:hypothetical protein
MRRFQFFDFLAGRAGKFLVGMGMAPTWIYGMRGIFGIDWLETIPSHTSHASHKLVLSLSKDTGSDQLFSGIA